MPPSRKDKDHGFGIGPRGSVRRALITFGIALLVLVSAGTVVYVLQNAGQASILGRVCEDVPSERARHPDDR